MRCTRGGVVLAGADVGKWWISATKSSVQDISHSRVEGGKGKKLG